MTRISRSTLSDDANVSGWYYSVQGLGNLLHYRNAWVVSLVFILGVDLCAYRCFYSEKIGWKACAIAGDADAIFIPISLITTIFEVYFPSMNGIYMCLFTPILMLTFARTAPIAPHSAQ